MVTNDIKGGTLSLHLGTLGTDIKQKDVEDTMKTVGDMKTR